MHYALKGKYPIETEDHIKTAVNYFDKFLTRLSPMERAAVATNIEKQAETLGVDVSRDWITNYSRMLKKEAAISPDFERNIQLRKDACLKDGIKVTVSGKEVDAVHLLEKVATLTDGVHGIAIVKALEAFDKLANLEFRYDDDIVDPVLTVFGSLRSPEYDAEKIAFNKTDYDLVKMSRKKEVLDKIAGVFTKEVADNFQKEPIKTFKEMTAPEQGLFLEKTSKLGEGKGVGGPRQMVGGAGKCICPSCGHTETHDRGTPCAGVKCPKCGTKMQGKK